MDFVVVDQIKDVLVLLVSFRRRYVVALGRGVAEKGVFSAVATHRVCLFVVQGQEKGLSL